MTSTLPSRIRIARTALGLSQTALAKASGTTGAAVCHWEQGKRVPHSYHLRAIALTLHVSTDWLLGIEDATTVPEIVSELLDALRGRIAEATS